MCLLGPTRQYLVRWCRTRLIACAQIRDVHSSLRSTWLADQHVLNCRASNAGESAPNMACFHFPKRSNTGVLLHRIPGRQTCENCRFGLYSCNGNITQRSRASSRGFGALGKKRSICQFTVLYSGCCHCFGFAAPTISGAASPVPI